MKKIRIINNILFLICFYFLSLEISFIFDFLNMFVTKYQGGLVFFTLYCVSFGIALLINFFILLPMTNDEEKIIRKYIIIYISGFILACLALLFI